MKKTPSATIAFLAVVNCPSPAAGQEFLPLAASGMPAPTLSGLVFFSAQRPFVNRHGDAVFRALLDNGDELQQSLWFYCSAAPGTELEFWRCGEPINTPYWGTLPATSPAGFSFVENKLRCDAPCQADFDGSGMWVGSNLASLQRIWINGEQAPGPDLVFYELADLPGIGGASLPVGVNTIGQAYFSAFTNVEADIFGFFAAHHAPGQFSVKHRIVVPGDELQLPPEAGLPTPRQVKEVSFGTAGIIGPNGRGSEGHTIDRASNGYGVLSYCGHLGFQVEFEDFDGGGEGVYIWTIPHPADLNGDGETNTLDFAAFQEAFNNMQPSADMNADGMFNTLDFTAFQNAFNWSDPCGP